MKHTLEFKEQILKEIKEVGNEIKEVGNVSLVCKRHGLKSRAEHGWLNKDRNKVKIAESKQTRQHLKKIKDLVFQVEVLISLLKKTYPLWNNEKPLF